MANCKNDILNDDSIIPSSSHCPLCGKEFKIDAYGILQAHQQTNHFIFLCDECENERIKQEGSKLLTEKLYKIDSSIDHPPHYCFGKYEVIDVLLDWFPDDPLLYQVGKYVARAGHKGMFLRDLEKARWYLDKRITMEKSNLKKSKEGENK